MTGRAEIWGLSVIEKRPRSLRIARHQLDAEVGAIQPAQLSTQRCGEIHRIGQLEAVDQRLSIGGQRKAFDEMLLGTRRQPVRDADWVLGEVGSLDDQHAILPSSEGVAVHAQRAALRRAGVEVRDAVDQNVWKKKYGGLSLTELRELRQLRDENSKLKRLVADLTLDRHVLQEIVKKKL